MASFVIDASATLPWCFDDEATAYTKGLLNRCAAGEEVMVASVWPLEITNGLLSAQRRGRVTAEWVEQFLVQILRFRMHVEPFTIQQTVRDVRQLAQTHQLTAYDAACLALALRYNLPLATPRHRVKASRAHRWCEVDCIMAIILIAITLSPEGKYRTVMEKLG
jgi:predicted nucleic acid-binding protein